MGNLLAQADAPTTPLIESNEGERREHVCPDGQMSGSVVALRTHPGNAAASGLGSVWA